MSITCFTKSFSKKTKNAGQTHIRFMLAVRIFFISHLGIGLRVQAFCLMALDRWVDGNPALSWPLEDILSEAGVDSVLGNSLISEGWTTKTFALAATSLAEFKPDSLTAEDVSPLQQACFRVAWQSCQGSSSSSTAPSGQSLTPAPSSGSWHESFAPKLTDEVIIRMKSEFKKFYPNEILVPETTPGTRMLPLIHRQLQKKTWAWIPWKFRISMARAEELKSGRSAKLPKLEGLGLHELLLDNPESTEISNTGMGVNSIRSMVELHNFGISLRGSTFGQPQSFFTQVSLLSYSSFGSRAWTASSQRLRGPSSRSIHLEFDIRAPKRAKLEHGRCPSRVQLHQGGHERITSATSQSGEDSTANQK